MTPGSGSRATSRRGRRAPHIAALLAGLLATVTALSMTVSASATAAPAAPTAPTSVDPTSRLSVRNAYQKIWLPAMEVPSGWSGSTSPCVPGRDTAAAQSATLKAVNFARELTGRTDVAMDTALSVSAMKAAVIQDATGKVVANPRPGNSVCWSKGGAAAAPASDLYIGPAPTITPGDAVDWYLGGSGVGLNATAADPRSWLLYSRQAQIGSGTTARANALYVQDSGSFLPAPAGSQAAAWPSAGWFPGQLVPDSLWSVSIPGADFTGASIRVAHREVPVVKADASATAGDSTIAFRYNPYWDISQGDQNIIVSVRYFHLNGKRISLNYTVTLFDATVGMPNRNVISYPWPTQGYTAGATVTPPATNNNALPVSYTSDTPDVCTISGSTIAMNHRGVCTVTAAVPHDARFPDATPLVRYYLVR